MRKRLLWTFLGALIGAFLGAGTGVVGSFGGVSGLIVFAVMGGVIGFFAAPDIQRIINRIAEKRNKDN